MRKIFLISMLSLFVFCSTGYAELIDNGDGTVTDTKTGLMWQKAEAGTKPWEAALAYCETLGLAGHSDCDCQTEVSFSPFLILYTIIPASTKRHFPMPCRPAIGLLIPMPIILATHGPYISGMATTTPSISI